MTKVTGLIHTYCKHLPVPSPTREGQYSPNCVQVVLCADVIINTDIGEITTKYFDTHIYWFRLYPDDLNLIPIALHHLQISRAICRWLSVIIIHILYGNRAKLLQDSVPLWTVWLDWSFMSWFSALVVSSTEFMSRVVGSRCLPKCMYLY